MQLACVRAGLALGRELCSRAEPSAPAAVTTLRCCGGNAQDARIAAASNERAGALPPTHAAAAAALDQIAQHPQPSKQSTLTTHVGWIGPGCARAGGPGTCPDRSVKTVACATRWNAVDLAGEPFPAAMGAWAGRQHLQVPRGITTQESQQFFVRTARGLQIIAQHDDVPEGRAVRCIHPGYV